ncbi:hypothetical protein [Paraliomyxa miuraensis]|uniref:hypothetical protein n=1 Tax=Paraliomyxa miuraensis TaxID=376150 RepID=UPI0022593D03|nr:hypothetical protein [Paraliomyxa miuraensis]MCX4245016.1 hypothetical protein [Paraliomyxa miuraensis]
MVGADVDEVVDRGDAGDVVEACRLTDAIGAAPLAELSQSTTQPDCVPGQVPGSPVVSPELLSPVEPVSSEAAVVSLLPVPSMVPTLVGAVVVGLVVEVSVLPVPVVPVPVSVSVALAPTLESSPGHPESHAMQAPSASQVRM